MPGPMSRQTKLLYRDRTINQWFKECQNLFLSQEIGWASRFNHSGTQAHSSLCGLLRSPDAIPDSRKWNFSVEDCVQSVWSRKCHFTYSPLAGAQSHGCQQLQRGLGKVSGWAAISQLGLYHHKRKAVQFVDSAMRFYIIIRFNYCSEQILHRKDNQGSEANYLSKVIQLVSDRVSI